MQEREPIEISIEARGHIVVDKYSVEVKGENLAATLYEALPDDLLAEYTNEKCFFGTLTLVVTEIPTFFRASCVQKQEASE